MPRRAAAPQHHHPATKGGYAMKSTRAFKILSIALAAAVVFYFLVQGVRYLTNPYATTRV